MMAATFDETENTDYENIMPPNINPSKFTPKSSKQSGQNAARKYNYTNMPNSEPKRLSGKGRSTNDTPEKGNTTRKTVESSLPAKQVKQFTKSMKIIATSSLIGLLVLSLAIGLIIYFIAVRHEDKKSTSSTAMTTPLPIVKTAPSIPNISSVKTSCELISWLPKFKIQVYGSHVWEAIGLFYAIKKKYYNEEKTKTLRLKFEIGLVQLDDISRSMGELYKEKRYGDFNSNSNRFIQYADRWMKCLQTNRQTECSYIPKIIKNYIENLDKSIVQANSAAGAMRKTIRHIAEDVSSLDTFRSQGENFMKYRSGFEKYFQSLEVVSSLLRYIVTFSKDVKIVVNRRSMLATKNVTIDFETIIAGNPRELACLTIAEQTLYEWTEPIVDFVKNSLDGEYLMKKEKAEQIFHDYEQLAEKLRYRSNETINAIIERWST